MFLHKITTSQPEGPAERCTLALSDMTPFSALRHSFDCLQKLKKKFFSDVRFRHNHTEPLEGHGQKKQKQTTKQLKYLVRMRNYLRELVVLDFNLGLHY